MLRRIKITLLAGIALTTLSCSEDFMETTPTDAIAAGDALATAENMALILNGLHRLQYAQPQTLIPGGDSYRSGNHYWVPLGDNTTGDVIHTASANNLGWQTELKWTSHTVPTSTTNEQLWYQRYHLIASVNAIIKKATDGSIPLDAQLRNIIGQAYTYRAFAYHDLVTHYAKGYLIGNPSTDPGVPLLFSSEAPFTSAPRSTVQEIYDQCMEDINSAISYFDGAAPRPTGSADAKSQLNIDVAQGIKARIALAKGDWAAAATAAAAARQNYPLMGESEYKSGFNTTLLSEVIWGSNVIPTETTYFRSHFYLLSNTFGGSQNRNNPKIMDKRLYNQIPETDYRRDLFLADAPNTNSSASNGQGGFGNDPNYTDEAAFNARRNEIREQYGLASNQNLHPYMHVKFLSSNPGTTDPDDIILMRSSEMYLIEAEAKTMLNDITGAQAALTPLAEARDSAYDVTAFNTQASMLDHIKFQRRLELWGEGFGYTDHIRWDEGIDHGADGGSGAASILYQNGYVQPKPSVNSDWIFKIPQKEIDANPNLSSSDQN